MTNAGPLWAGIFAVRVFESQRVEWFVHFRIFGKMTGRLSKHPYSFVP